MRTEHAFAYAYLGICRALLSMNDINLRKNGCHGKFYCSCFRFGKSVSIVTRYVT